MQASKVIHFFKQKILLLSICFLMSQNVMAQGSTDAAFDTLVQDGKSVLLIFVDGLTGIPECLHFSLTGGVCFFIVFNGPFVSIEARPEISHRAPDILNLVYNEPGAFPIPEVGGTLGRGVRALGGLIAGAVGGGSEFGGSAPTVDEAKNPVTFKEGSVIPHPTAIFFNNIGKKDTAPLCPTGVTNPVIPFFLSESDLLLWRQAIPFASIIDSIAGAIRRIGEGPNFVGELRARGPEYTMDPPDHILKTVVVTTEMTTAEGRFSDTNTAGHAIIQQVSADNCDKDGCTTGEVKANESLHGVHRAIFPEATGCGVIGADTTFDEWKKTQSETQNAIFETWHCYQCCIEPSRSHIYLFTTPSREGCITTN